MTAIAQRKDLPALTSLWQTCFGDSEDSIRMFFDALFAQIQVFFTQQGGQPVSMLCALPAQLIDDTGQAHRIAYIYAVCTAPRFRGRGLSRQLLSYAENVLKKEGYVFSALVPSTPSLFDFYRSAGYETAFFHTQYMPGTSDAPVGSAVRVDAARYAELREMLLQCDFVSFDMKLLQYQQAVCECSGAGLYAINLNHCVCCAAAERRGRALLLKELLPNEPAAAMVLARELGCDTVTVRTPGIERPFGMIKPLGALPAPQNCYLGFAFD